MPANNTTSEEFLQNIIKITEANLVNEHFGVSELAKEMGISRSSLHRKVKQFTNQSASRFICTIRLKKAYQLLQENAGSVSEVAYRVGFASSTYFSKCFHDYYGISPGEVKNGKEPLKADDKKSAEKTSRTKPVLILLVFALTLFLAGGAIYTSHQQHNHSKQLMILIPENDLNNAEINSITSSLQYELRSKLDQFNGLNIVSESTSISYSKSGFTIKKIARSGIDYVLLLQPVSIKNKITIYSELTDTKTNEVLISAPYELSKLSDNMHHDIEELTSSLASSIKGEIFPAENNEHLTSYK